MKSFREITSHIPPGCFFSYLSSFCSSHDLKSFSKLGFFKVLGQLTETGVVNPEQFMSKYYSLFSLNEETKGN
jgi:hypothetical protein